MYGDVDVVGKSKAVTRVFRYMATIVASASAVSSHSSAQHGESDNLFNDSLSFSNNNVLERRRTNTNAHLSLVSPPIVVVGQSLSLSVGQRPDRWDPENHIIVEDIGQEDGQLLSGDGTRITDNGHV